MTARQVRVLVVEDQPDLAELHCEYVNRVDGFVTVAVAHCGSDALASLTAFPVDLVLLDFYLPDLNGLEVCRLMRARRHTVDVIAVTAARDLATVREAVAQGVVHYIIKPFTFMTLRDRLRRYAEYRAIIGDRTASDQQEVDRLMLRLVDPAPPQLPKNLRPETMAAVTAALSDGKHATASDIATRVGAARVTVRRYLEQLVREGSAEQTLRYGRRGRPEVLYRMRDGTGN